MVLIFCCWFSFDGRAQCGSNGLRRNAKYVGQPLEIVFNSVAFIRDANAAYRIRMQLNHRLQQPPQLRSTIAYLLFESSYVKYNSRIDAPFLFCGHYYSHTENVERYRANVKEKHN